MALGKTIVLMRSYHLWLAQVPELGSYPYIRLNHPSTRGRESVGG